MSRVPDVQAEDLQRTDPETFRFLSERYGHPLPSLFLALSNAPDVLRAFVSCHDSVRAARGNASTDHGLIELASMMVGYVTKCGYQFDRHWNSAVDAGVPREKLERLGEFETADVYSDRERAALQYAAEVTRHGNVSDATWIRLSEFLTVQQKLEIVIIIAWYNLAVRVLNPLGVKTEEWFERR